MDSAVARGAGLDGKTALQELAASLGKGAPEYLVSEEVQITIKISPQLQCLQVKH
jgi:hypothetical protein